MKKLIQTNEHKLNTMSVNFLLPTTNTIKFYHGYLVIGIKLYIMMLLACCNQNCSYLSRFKC